MDLGGIPCDYDRIYQAVEGKKALFCPKGDVQEALGRVAVVADCAHGLGASRHGCLPALWQTSPPSPSTP